MASLGTENTEGATALMLACQRGDVEHVDKLLKENVGLLLYFVLVNGFHSVSEHRDMYSLI